MTLIVDVEGWCNPKDRELLEKYARETTHRLNIVEIGTYHGLSALIIADAIKERQPAPLFYSVDPHLPVPGKSFGSADMVACYKNLARYPSLSAHVRRIVLPSALASWAFASETVGMLYVDGDHTLPGVKLDLAYWLPTMVKGGVVLFHDHQLPSVRDAIASWGSRLSERSDSTQGMGVYTYHGGA